MSKHTSYGDGATVRRFATLLAARTPLRQYAADWEETTASSSGTGSRGGLPADPVIARLLRTPEGHGLADQAAKVADQIDEWMRTGNQLARIAQRLLPMDHPVAEMFIRHRELRQSGAGICQRCKRQVPGIVENKLDGIEADRLKSGFCFGQPPHCYEAWRRSGMRDRATFIANWDHGSGTPETAGASLDAPDALQLSASSGEVRPTGSPYCEHVPPNLTDPDSFRCPICNPSAAGAA